MRLDETKKNTHPGKNGPKIVADIKDKTVKVCQKCKQKVGKGIRHKCTVSQTKQVDNLLTLADNNNVLEEKIASTVIQKKKAKRGEEVTLRSKRGRAVRLKVNPVKEKEVMIPHDDLDAMQAMTGSSDKAHIKGIKVLRKSLGRKKVQPYYREKLRKDAREARNFLRKYFLAFISSY